MSKIDAPDRTSEVVPAATLFAELPDGFSLKRGGVLHGARIAYETHGRLADDGSNAILVFGGFSASAHIASHPGNTSPGWWEEMVGPGKAVDTNRWFVICFNAPGGCFGSTGPASVNPRSGRKYRLDFPEISIEDIAEAARCLVRQLGVRQLSCVIGTSMGGMSALALLHRYPDIARTHINISGAARAATYAIALRSLQRQAILNDPAWRRGQYEHAADVRVGMSQARMLGMLSYRSPEEWQQRFARDRIAAVPAAAAKDEAFAPEFMVEGYLWYKVNGFVGHYDPNCYLYLSRAIDRFDLADETDGDLHCALSQLDLERSLVIGTKTDILFPAWQQAAIVDGLNGGKVPTEILHLDSLRGHDAFLAEFDQFAPPVGRFLASIPTKRPAVSVM
ncbi:homoserine O-acetyltransferase [Sulfitobacter sp. F26204]|uniref:homoserine O-acetyltransferase MetX n=1 Tax=Sulfitobacter sp. F26204 TaxID=2996014 RepID=UPI00225E0A36|nr:homoserine O-acetyltransferase [Sulfitobacter sp. F26204]MCX7561887.1 homoserine O-acetyltransferase [Sulfitobacter sp. F26204]